VRCVFVHGWGMNRQVWQPLVDKLPSWIEVELIDLPGHGSRYQESFRNLDELSDDLEKICLKLPGNDLPLVMVGWSLGALPCMKVAIEARLDLSALMFVSSNPCFVSKKGWAYGVESQVFEQFAQSLKDDFSGTIRRFLSLQVKGSDSGRAVLRELREKILQQEKPDKTSLDAGLDILKQTDLRLQLSEITQPVCWMLGGQDGLVKSELADVLGDLMTQPEVKVFNKAGHAPFLSHADEFIQQLVSFLSNNVLKNS